MNDLHSSVDPRQKERYNQRSADASKESFRLLAILRSPITHLSSTSKPCKLETFLDAQSLSINKRKSHEASALTTELHKL